MFVFQTESAMTEPTPDRPSPFDLIQRAFLKLDKLLLGGDLTQEREHLSIERRTDKVVMTLDTGAVAFLDKEGRLGIANHLAKRLLEQGITDIKVVSLYNGPVPTDKLDETTRRRHGLLDNAIQVIVTVPESADFALKIEAAYRSFVVDNLATTMAASAREFAASDPASFFLEVAARAQKLLAPTTPVACVRAADVPKNDI